MDNYSITEDYKLPSLGSIYGKEITYSGKIRSMTTVEEMRRQAATERPYKAIANLIDDCLIDKPGISSYDMHLGDYQYLLHRLRVATYGSKYKMSSICPYCGKYNESEINLNDIPLTYWEKSFDDLLSIKLPKTGKLLKLKFQTPRSLDEISIRQKEHESKHPNTLDRTLIYTISDLIDTVDGMKLDPVNLETFIEKLPMGDTNYILKTAEKINLGLGMDTNVSVSCTNNTCGKNYLTRFRTTPEFFGPSID